MSNENMLKNTEVEETTKNISYLRIAYLFIAVSLGATACLGWIRYVLKKPSQKIQRRMSLPCSHWIQIEGAVRSPGRVCLSVDGGYSKRTLWNKAIQKATPLCSRTSTLYTLPIPRHGYVAHITSSTRTSKCQMKIRTMSATQRIIIGIKIDVNRSQIQDLCAIPKISKRTAMHIVLYRKQKGLFRSWDELLDVRGVGPKTLLQLKRYGVLQKMKKNVR